MELWEDPLYLPEVGLPDEFLNYIDQRAGLLVGKGGGDDGGAGQIPERRPLSYHFPHRTFQEYLAGCYLVSLPDVAEEYWQHAELGDGWDIAAQLGGEELYYNSSSGANTLLPVLYHLCPSDMPQNKDDWRRLLWSAQLATLFNPVEIERHKRGAESGIAYRKRLTERLLLVCEEKCELSISDRAAAARALGRLGDPRPGVGVKNGLPDIAWCQIEAGPFVMGGDGVVAGQPQFTCTLIRQPYAISRYPITVAQYQCFVDAGGYEAEQYWTKTGWQWRQQKKITAPEAYSEVFGVANHPQVGVSWYEAVAYCRWLSAQMGKEIRLPSEAEWERAARHNDGRTYPWGNQEEYEQRCNMGESGIGSTSAVGIFPSGNATCGAADMGGNVWEWCSTAWQDDYESYEQNVTDDLTVDGFRVLRGGSFFDPRGGVRCASRDWSDPVIRDNGVGFRVVMSLGS